MLLPAWGEPGQERLAAATVALVGCGALGCTIADALVRAGVGAIRLIDRDVVELTNLQRQVLFDERDASEGLPKAEAAARRLRSVNHEIAIEPMIADFVPSNAERLTEGVDLLIDGTDNFETRYLLNDLAVKKNIPYIYGGAVATRGMAMTILPGTSPCLRCMFDEPPPPGTTQTCDTAGVLGPLIGIVGSLQATDAIRVLLGLGPASPSRLTEVDPWQGVHRAIDMCRAKRDDCACCGSRRFDYLNGARAGDTVSLCGQTSVQVSPGRDNADVDLAALATRLASHGVFQHLPRIMLRGTLRTERGDGDAAISLTVFADGRAIFRGTSRPERARSLYARYIGA